MNAKQHTYRMLLWLKALGIERLDLALRQSDATFIWHRSKTFDQLIHLPLQRGVLLADQERLPESHEWT